MDKKEIEQLQRIYKTNSDEIIRILLFTKRPMLFNKAEKRKWEKFKRNLPKIGFIKQNHLGQIYAYISRRNHIIEVLKRVEEILPPSFGVEFYIADEISGHIINNNHLYK